MSGQPFVAVVPVQELDADAFLSAVEAAVESVQRQTNGADWETAELHVIPTLELTGGPGVQLTVQAYR